MLLFSVIIPKKSCLDSKRQRIIIIYAEDFTLEYFKQPRQPSQTNSLLSLRFISSL